MRLSMKIINYAVVYLSLVFSFIWITSAIEDAFTAIIEMEPLILLEQKLAKLFLEYVKIEEERLDTIEKFLVRAEKNLLKDNSSDDIVDYVGNPANAYMILKRFHFDWTKVNDKFSKKNSTLLLQTKLKKVLDKYMKEFPLERDVVGAVTAIFRLQDLYKVHPSQFADGLGPKSHKLTMEEVFELGYIATGLGDFPHAKSWLTEAFNRFHPDARQIGFLDRVGLLEYLSWSEYQTGDLENAIKHTKEILRIDPNSKSAATNIDAYQQDLLASKTDPSVRKIKKIISYVDHPEKYDLDYDGMCNGEAPQMNPKDRSKLYCKLVSPHPMNILKPEKMEKAFSEPDIFVYHDFVTDFEMERIKKKARPKLRRATVHDVVTGKLSYADYRISKSAWIREEEDEVIFNVYKKVEALTGLDLRYSESLQVVNYGCGGHYEPHYDYAQRKSSEIYKMGWGNRIATVLLYLSDVYHGGDTVFVRAGPGAQISPRKGMAVFWYNLKRSGVGDKRTRHAACPVLLGNKWVANFWIHEVGQEFIRPCGLKKDD